MRIITIPEPAGRFRVATKAELEAAATFTLTLTERDIKRVHGLFDEWADRHKGGRWRFLSDIGGIETRTFKWVEVKGVNTFPVLVAKIRRHGNIPSHDWCVAIQRIPRSARPFPCAIADTALAFTNGDEVFVCVFVNGTVNFLPAEGGDYTGWRWLVEVRGE